MSLTKKIITNKDRFLCLIYYYQTVLQTEKCILLFCLGNNMNIKTSILTGHAASIKSSLVLIHDSSQIAVLVVGHFWQKL